LNLGTILAELKSERDRINQAIALLAKIKSVKKKRTVIHSPWSLNARLHFSPAPSGRPQPASLAVGPAALTHDFCYRCGTGCLT
jgi:hypothetical protein